MWNCPYSNDSFPVYAEDIDGGASQSAAVLSQVGTLFHSGPISCGNAPTPTTAFLCALKNHGGGASPSADVLSRASCIAAIYEMQSA